MITLCFVRSQWRNSPSRSQYWIHDRSRHALMWKHSSCHWMAESRTSPMLLLQLILQARSNQTFIYSELCHVVCELCKISDKYDQKSLRLPVIGSIFIRLMHIHRATNQSSPVGWPKNRSYLNWQRTWRTPQSAAARAEVHLFHGPRGSWNLQLLWLWNLH